MRYFIIKYYRTPQGQFNEQGAVVSRLKTKDLDQASVIMDFKEQKIVKASINGATVTERDWATFLETYREHYSETLDQLINAWDPGSQAGIINCTV